MWSDSHGRSVASVNVQYHLRAALGPGHLSRCRQYLRASMFAEEEPALNDIDLKVIVPNGLVIALSKADPGRKLWDYKVGNNTCTCVILCGYKLLH